MADLKTQIAISADASGVEAGVKNAKRSLADLGATAANAGKQGSEGLDAIGKGGDRSSAKVDAATKNMIGSIQRTTAAMEAGGRTSSKYFETLASQRGIDVGALKPYLTQLDEVAAKQALAEKAITRTVPALNAAGLSAKQAAFAARGLPAQFTDIAVSLQAGQNPLTVFLQQGGQLKDMFGGIGPAARALGGYIASLISPFTIAAAAAGALAFAYNRGSKEADAYAKALILTGNAAGSSVGQLDAMARSIDGVVGTQSAAAEALALFAANGAIAGQNIERFTTIAIRMERVAGQAISETVKQFAELGKAPLEASVKLNESMRHLTQTTYEQIKALEQQGRLVEAASIAQKTYADALETRSGQIETQLGSIERAWRGIKDTAKEAWDSMLGIGRKDSIQKQLDAVSKEIAKAREPFDANPWSGNAEARAKLPQNLALQASLQEMLRLETRGAEAAKAAADQTKARIDFDKDGEKYLDRRLKLEREISEARAKGLAAGASQKEINDRIAAITAKYAPKGGSAVPAKGVEAENPLDAFRRSEISGTDAVNRADDQAKWADIAKTRRAAADEQERLNGLIAATPTGQIDKQRETMQFLADKFTAGKITAEQFNEAATTALGNIAPAAKEAGEEIDQFSIQAARNIQTSLGDTLKKTLRGDFKGIGDLWKNTLLDMIAQAQAAKLNKWLFGADFGKTGEVGGALGGLFKDIGGLFGGATKMATGTNYVPRDNFPALLHKGEAVIPAKFNPAAGGTATGGINYAPTFHIDGGMEPARVAQVAAEVSQAGLRDFQEQLRAAGAIA